MTIRRSAALAGGAAVVIAAVVTAGSDTAQAAAGQPCRYGALAFKDNSTIPTARTPGQYIQNSVIMRNQSGVTLHQTTFDFSMVLNPSPRKAPPAPTVYWREDGHRWHKLPMYWHKGTNGNLSYFESNDATIGTITTGSTHKLTFKVAFHRGDPGIIYIGDIQAGALGTCGHQLLGDGIADFAFA